MKFGKRSYLTGEIQPHVNSHLFSVMVFSVNPLVVTYSHDGSDNIRISEIFLNKAQNTNQINKDIELNSTFPTIMVYAEFCKNGIIRHILHITQSGIAQNAMF